jgi:hypothetical protein
MLARQNFQKLSAQDLLPKNVTSTGLLQNTLFSRYSRLEGIYGALFTRFDGMKEGQRLLALSDCHSSVHQRSSAHDYPL